MNDEARLTAYALGELEPAESAAVEQRLAQDAAAREEVESVRAVAQLLESELAAEPAPGLTEGQVQRVLAGPTPDDPPAPLRRPGLFRGRTLWATAGLAAAACLAIVAAVPIILMNTRATEYAIEDVAPASESIQATATPLAKGPDIAGSAEAPGRSRRARGAGPAAGAELDPTSGGKPRGAGAGPVPGAGGGGGMGGRSLTLDAASAGEAAPADAEQLSEQLSAHLEVPRRVLRETEGAATTDLMLLSAEPNASSAPRPAAVVPPPPATAAPGAPSGGATVGGEMVRMGRGRPRSLDERRETPELDADLRAQDDDFGRAARPDGESYAAITDNPFVRVEPDTLSTFSIDVDTAGYANVRRMINQGMLPPPDAVRIEELLNYFNYDYPVPTGEHPIAVSGEVGSAPWAPDHRLVRIGVRATDIDANERPPTNLVFLIDVSGSMNDPRKLPLLKQSMKMLVDRLTPDDRVAIAVYAGAAGLRLDSTFCYRKQEILDAIDDLSAGGSTNGGEGIRLAYAVAREHFIEGGVNRVILATDGDLNVGVTSDEELVELITEQRRSGVELTVLGFGTGNFKDSKLEAISNAGNGNFAYIDSVDEARKVLVEEMGGTLVTVARDVKLQVDFNADRVAAYRLIGYENRMLAAQDFDDDTKDAGEIGSGHTVTALYEIVPREETVAATEGEAETATRVAAAETSGATGPLLTVRVRYKPLDEDVSTRFDVPLNDLVAGDQELSADFHFASAVAAFGMSLRDSPYKGSASLDLALELAGAGLGDDATLEPQAGSYRAGFVELIQRASEIATGRGPTLTPEQIEAMTHQEALRALAEVSTARRRARAVGDRGMEERLRQQFDLLMRRVKRER